MFVETIDTEKNYLYAMEYDGQLIFATKHLDRHSKRSSCNKKGFTQKTKWVYTNLSHAKSAHTTHTRGMDDETKNKYKIVKLRIEKVEE